MTIAATGTLTTEQAQRATALEKARVVLQVSQAFGSQPPEAEDLVAVARFILDGTDLYEGEDEEAPSYVVNIAPGAIITPAEAQAMADYATEASTYEPSGDLTADDVVEGRAYMVLPGVSNSGMGRVPTPLEGTVVTAVEDGVDEDGDVLVEDQDGHHKWVLPEYLTPAL